MTDGPIHSSAPVPGKSAGSQERETATSLSDCSSTNVEGITRSPSGLNARQFSADIKAARALGVDISTRHKRRPRVAPFSRQMPNQSLELAPWVVPLSERLDAARAYLIQRFSLQDIAAEVDRNVAKSIDHAVFTLALSKCSRTSPAFDPQGESVGERTDRLLREGKFSISEGELKGHMILAIETWKKNIFGNTLEVEGLINETGVHYRGAFKWAARAVGDNVLWLIGGKPPESSSRLSHNPMIVQVFAEHAGVSYLRGLMKALEGLRAGTLTT